VRPLALVLTRRLRPQCSEYPAVVIPVVIRHYPMLQRNMLQTGVTRGPTGGCGSGTEPRCHVDPICGCRLEGKGFKPRAGRRSTRGRRSVRERRTPGSALGTGSNPRPYRTVSHQHSPLIPNSLTSGRHFAASPLTSAPSALSVRSRLVGLGFEAFPG
jgi:hypothetical protein